MNIVFKSLVCFSLIAVSAVDAALPPFYQNLVEYKTLLNSQELANKFGSAEGILDIKRTEKGFFITGYKHTLTVEIIYDSQDRPGPAKFHLVFQNLEPLD